MLNLLGKGVLISNKDSRFVQLAATLEKRGGSDSIEYIMGMDTFNRVCEDATQCFPEDKHKLRKMSIVVNERNGLTINDFSKNLNIRPIMRQNNFSSTQAREGDHSGISQKVSAYIHDNCLYGDSV